jgi:hypothetical protein
MCATPEERIPRSILDRLLELRPLLETTGGCIRRRERDGTYRLRVRAPGEKYGQVRKSIALGDEGVAADVQALIDGWREAKAAEEPKVDRESGEERAYRKQVKALRRAMLVGIPGSGRRRRAAREFDEAARDPMSLYGYLLAGAPPARIAGRPGRKRKGGLA